MRYFRTFKALIFKFIKFFGGIIPNGMQFIILLGPLKGYRWIAGAADGKAKGLSVLLNLYESKQIDIAKELSSKSTICFDIGAYVGLYTLLFARYSKFVYSFEPLPRNISFLYKTLILNAIKNAMIIPCAVADINGISWFKEGKYTARGRLTKRGKLPVMCISLDYFIEQIKIYPDIIKIDVEGAEWLVLKGAKNLILKRKPIILLSTHGKVVKHDCLTFLNNIKYQKIVPLNANSIKNATEFLAKP